MNAAAPAQLTLDLPTRTALGAEDFFVAPSNEMALAYLDRWPDWPTPAALLTGEEGTGKTHLAHVWCLQSGAAMVAAASISVETVKKLGRVAALVVEDVHDEGRDDEALFHLLNMSREQNIALLLTARQPAGALDVALPDLRSRLRALAHLQVEQPDDHLLKAIMVKLFGDRQLIVSPDLINYMAQRMDRSMANVLRTVSTLDRYALSMGRRITKPLARDVMDQVSGASDV